MNQVAEKLRQEIANHGAISFARFMESALYCPVYGYYEKEGDTPGRRGDFFTSVSVGPLFGELLALQFSEWLSAVSRVASIEQEVGPRRLRATTDGKTKVPADFGRPQIKGTDDGRLSLPLQIVEAGAHKGDLARDILNWIRTWRPDLFSVIKYSIVEPSERRQAWQRRALATFGAQVSWTTELSQLVDRADAVRGIGGIIGVIFSNELLDAMPVQRYGWDAAHGTWFEWGVTFSDGRFTWIRLQNSNPEIGCLGWPEEILKRLPDGFIVDRCPAASQWWTRAAKILERGYLLTLDYGWMDHELINPERTKGTLRAYRSHHLAPDVLSEPGQQDITAHVNFSALCRAGEMAGLRTDALKTQEQFLTQIAAPVLENASGFGEWTKDRIRQFQTLTHPNHLGKVFRVLVQSRVSRRSPWIATRS